MYATNLSAGFSLRDKVRGSAIREGLNQEGRVEPMLLHIKKSQLRWKLIKMPPGCLLGEVFWGITCREMAGGQIQDKGDRRD